MVFLVGLGGIFGAMSRYLISKWASTKFAYSFPWGTWILNITGSFLLGWLAFLHINHQINNWIWLLCGTGFLGGYTTFSTFGYEFLQLIETKKIIRALVYVISSVTIGLLAAWAGHSIA